MIDREIGMPGREQITTSDDDTMAGSPPNPFNFVYGTRGAAMAILPAAARLPESRGSIATGLRRFTVFTSNRNDRVGRRAIDV